MVLLQQASGQAGDGQKGSICALSSNETAPSDCSSPFWCRQADVPPLHSSGYGWCTDEAKPSVDPALGTAAMSSSVGLLFPVSPVEANLLSVRERRSVMKYGYRHVLQCIRLFSREESFFQSAACLLTTPALPELRLSGRLLAKNPACAHLGKSHDTHCTIAELLLHGSVLCLQGAQAATANAQTSPLDGFEAAVRTTRTDAVCRIPIVYRHASALTYPFPARLITLTHTQMSITRCYSGIHPST